MSQEEHTERLHHFNLIPNQHPQQEWSGEKSAQPSGSQNVVLDQQEWQPRGN